MQVCLSFVYILSVFYSPRVAFIRVVISYVGILFQTIDTKEEIRILQWLRKNDDEAKIDPCNQRSSISDNTNKNKVFKKKADIDI